VFGLLIFSKKRNKKQTSRLLTKGFVVIIQLHYLGNMKANLKVILAIAGYLCLNAAIAQGDPEFVLVKQEDSVFIYERWIKFPGTEPPQDAREVKGEFTVHSTANELIRLLKSPKWVMKSQKHVSEFKVYPLAVDTAWLEYSYHDIPWPVSDQDHFLVYKVTKEDENEMIVAFESTKNDKLAPERSGVARMNLLGSWTINKLDENRVKVVYSIISQPGNIPRIFTDPIIRRNIVITIQSIIEILEEDDL